MAVPPQATSARVLSIAAGVAVLAAVSISGWQWAEASDARITASAHRPIAVHDQGYVSSDTCRSCHPNEYASWFGSYHRTMTQVATPASVHGDFANVVLNREPFYRVDREGDQFIFETAELPEHNKRRLPISLVTGSHHMQIYWFEIGETRKLGQLPFVYLTSDQRWVPRAAVFLEPPRPMRRPDESGRWSQSCITCHTTQGQPRIDHDKGTFDTHVAEFGIACEACHGPAQAHVAKNSSPLARYRGHLSSGHDDTIVQPKRLNHRRSSEICSQCHSLWQDHDQQALREWNDHGFSYRPGQDASASRWLMQPSHKEQNPRVAEVVAQQPGYVLGQFWSDGMARVSGREFSGMIDSPCYVPGEMSCLSCHRMHQDPKDRRTTAQWANDQLDVGMDGDRACLQCHSKFENDLSVHTKHKAESSGSRCYNCHMPHTSYGLLKAMRSHRISSPSAEETLKTGRPNACNACHLDKSLGWTAAMLRERHGIASPPIEGDQADVPSSLLLALTGDAGQRALIAWALGWAPAHAASNPVFMPALLGVLMDDPYDAVRYIAGHSLRTLPNVDLTTLNYDFVPRPDTRAPVAPRVASLQRPPLSAAEAERQRALFQRLLPGRNHRAVILLE